MDYKNFKINTTHLSTKSFVGIYTTPDAIIPQVFPFRKAIFSSLQMVFYQSALKISHIHKCITIPNMGGNGCVSLDKMLIGPNPKMYSFSCILCSTSCIHYIDTTIATV